MSSFVFPLEGNWLYTYKISLEVLSKVDAIREKALALGWSVAGLYQNRGTLKPLNGSEYGLICYLRDGDRIGGVTREFIEIIRRSPGEAKETHTRHYNHDVDLPWMKRA